MTGERVGLCADCVHAQVVESARGSRFYRCRRAESDPRFRKYPALPVLECVGYERQTGDLQTGEQLRGGQ